MDNQIAAPCCGSCEHCDYDLCDRTWYCCAKELEKQSVTNRDYLCEGNYYLPRNPIPIIDIPGVKELVEAACRASSGSINI